jgi:hypothetical protein
VAARPECCGVQAATIPGRQALPLAQAVQSAATNIQQSIDTGIALVKDDIASKASALQKQLEAGVTAQDNALDGVATRLDTNISAPEDSTTNYGT